jgi:ketosteroid isomerase-like protein
MSEASNTQVAKDAFAAFLRGDVTAILDLLDEGVEWEAVKGTEGVAPHAGLRRGRSAVEGFFRQVNETIAFDAFEPLEFVAQGNTVVAIGRYSGQVKPTGGPFSCDWVMAFTLRNGKIVRFREWTDSAQLAGAFGVKAVAPAAYASGRS